VALNFGDRHDALVCILQMLARLLRRDGPRAFSSRMLAIICRLLADAMLHLLKKNFLLAQQLFRLFEQFLPFSRLDRPAGGDNP